MFKFLVSIASMSTLVILMLGLSACGQERAPVAQSAASTHAVAEKPAPAEAVAEKAAPAEAVICIDPSKVEANRMCTMDYSPVCGCDGKTHSNACRAASVGVSTWVKGECSGAVTE